MTRLPRQIVQNAAVAGGIAIFQSLVTTIMSSVLVAQYHSCVSEDVRPHLLFMRLIRVHYFQDPACGADAQDGIMTADQVHIWLIILLSFSLVWLVASVALVMCADEAAARYLPLVGCSWAAATSAVLVIHLALAVLFGIDVAYLNKLLGSAEGASYEVYMLDMLRLGALLLLALSAQGFVLFAAHAAFAGLMVAHSFQVRRLLDSSEHSMHTQGPLNAFSDPKRPSWQQHPYDSTLERSTNFNRGFSDTEITTWRDNPQNDFLSSREFNRSDSWHHSRAAPAPHSASSAPAQPKAAPSPAALPPWRRDQPPWEPTPPLPAPDYSPVGGRRLKSALKH